MSFDPYRSPQSSPKQESRPSGPDDPVVSTARRESLVVLGAWIVALVWTVGYCVTYGYTSNGYNTKSMQLVLGIPDWIFWGVLTPWFSCYLFSNWFCLVFMKDADLGADSGDDEEDGDGF